MKKSVTTYLGLFTAAMLGLSACASGEAGRQEPQQGDVEGVVASIAVAEDFDPDASFSWGYTTAPTSLDPHRGTSGFDQNWLFPMYDRLVYASPDGEIEPMLAESWEIEEEDEGTAITFTLQEGVTFSDGSEFDAEAAKYSLDRARSDDSTVAGELSNVQDVEVVDQNTIKLLLDGGAGSVLGSLADRAGMIVSQDAAENGDLANEPVGIGAYVLADYRPGDRVVYERSEGYWDESAQNVAEMTFQVMPDDQTRLNALQSGELDMVLLRQNQVDPAVESGFNVLSDQSPTFYYFGVNTAEEPFDDPNVRRALHMAIDRDAIGNGLFEGYCTPQISPWPMTSFAYDEEIGDGLDEIPYDPEGAKELLAEAGYPDGFSFEAMGASITGYTDVAEAVQAQLSEIGVDVTLTLATAAEMSDRFEQQKTVPAVISGYSPSPDPQGVMSRLLLPEAAANPGGYTNENLEVLAEQAGAVTDPGERGEVYSQILQEMMKEVPSALPICMQHRTEAFTDSVSGLTVYPSGGREFRDVAVSSEGN